MKKLFTSYNVLKSIIFLLFFCLVCVDAQTYTKTILNSGGPYSALTRDKVGNIYVIKATSETTASVYKYASGDSKVTEIYTGLTRDGITYPWGLAISTSGNVYVSTSFDQDISKIIKLTVSGNTYTASDFQTTKNYYTGLTIDNNDNLYALQYDSTAKKYKIVKYSNINTTNSAGTDIYNNIDSGTGFSYPTNLAINSNGEFYYNEPFSVDGSNIKKGGIKKIKGSTSSVLSSDSYVTAVSIDENDNVYTLEGNGSNSDYKINKYSKGNTTSTSVSVNGTTTLAKSSDFIYPYGVVFTNNTGYYLDGDDGTLGGSLVKLTLNNVAPTFTNLNGDTVSWPGVGNTVSLDSGGNVNVKDADFDTLNNGQGNWKGAKLKVQRKNTAITSDSFWFSNPAYTIMGNSIQANGGIFATFTNENGVLEITFTSAETIATTNLVNEVIRSITYRNDTPAGNASMQFTLTDGYDSVTAIVNVNSDFIYVNSTIEDEVIDLTNGVSLTEAFAIANDPLLITGFNPSIVFTTNMNINLLNPVMTVKPINFEIWSSSVTINSANLFQNLTTLNKKGLGTLKLNNFKAFNLIINVNAGNLSVKNLSFMNIHTDVGTTLIAEGTLEGNIINNGNLIIGENTTENLIVIGSLNMTPSSTTQFKINNNINNILTINGSLSLSGFLNIDATNYIPKFGDQFTFIKQSNPIIGMFNNYPEGAQYMINGMNFKITYKGGIGNDMVLAFQHPKTIWENNLWSNGIPDNTKDAIIREQYNESVIANTITFESDILIPNGKIYNITNQVINQNNHKVVFEDGAYLIQSNDNSNTGKISFKRKSKPIYRLETLDWSSPVTGQNIFLFSPETLTNRFYRFIEGANTWYQHTFGSTSEFIPGEYVAFRAPNTFNDYGSGEAKIFEGIFTGVPFNGIKLINVTNETYGNNAVGNPYPSPLDLNSFLKFNNNVSKVFVWTHSKPIKNGVYEGNNWITYSRGSGWDDPTISNNILGVGQGFIVQVNQSSKIQFDNSMRIGNNPTISYRTSKEDDKFWLSLSKDSQVMNYTLIGYIKGSTLDYDNDFDAKPMEAFPGIYSNLKDDLMTIQARGYEFDINDKVKIGLKLNSASNYTIKLAKTNGLFNDSQSIFLKDNQLDKIIDLKKENYQFISEDGEIKNRFEIVYQNSTLGLSNQKTNSDLEIYNEGQKINIKSEEYIKSINVVDLTGQLLHQYNSVNEKNFSFTSIKASNVIIIIVELIDGNRISKKILLK